MTAKAIFFFCAQALLIQSGFSQCFGRNAAIAPAVAPCGLAGAGLAYGGQAAAEYGLAGNTLAYDAAYNTGFAPNYVTGPAFDFAPTYGVAPASGGALPISSPSPIAPSGLYVRSDNVIEGILAVTGSMPFVSAVAIEGVLPTAGSGAISYGCGNGAIGIVSENGYGAAVADEIAYGNGLAYGNGMTYGSDLVFDNSVVYDNSLGYGNGLAYDNGLPYNNGLAYSNNLAYEGVVGPSYAGCGCSTIY